VATAQPTYTINGIRQHGLYFTSGSGPVVDWSSVPPNRRGTYEVRADHTLPPAFADGTERIDNGSLKAPGDGIVLGGDGSFDRRD